MTAYLQPIFPPIPLHRGRKVCYTLVDSRVAPEFRIVGTEHDAVSSSPVSSYSVISVGIRRVEVEYKEEVPSFENDDFVRLWAVGTVSTLTCSSCRRRRKTHLVLETNVSLLRSQPTILILEVVHSLVKVVQVTITKERVVREVELSAGILVGIVVSSSREIQPFRVTKFAGERERTRFSSKPTRNGRERELTFPQS